jgi:hypothetical protein
LGEARAEDPARHGNFVSFLHSFGAWDSAEMIFSSRQSGRRTEPRVESEETRVLITDALDAVSQRLEVYLGKKREHVIATAMYIASP